MLAGNVYHHLQISIHKLEGQVVVASQPKVTVTNVLHVTMAKLDVVAQFIDVSKLIVGPSMALVTGAAIGSAVNIIIAIIIVSILLQ
ncbi:MAG: hypothetical protein EZS28_023324 [Streblomastix strix]|uniref:Uncharacterized protein n=1 Tax=Streblomastix strix TaxID=222440 RepID=A0A5J4VF17_9EUKA|nr:MAG: hypothetical protein EZS28_023324 [Streblomastix strix]